MTATTKRGVKCGNCGSYHGSASEVQGCYQGTRSDNCHDQHVADHVARGTITAERGEQLTGNRPGTGERHRLNAQINGRWDGSNTRQSPLQHGRPQPVPATEKQVAFIQRLAEERGLDLHELPGHATKAEASKLIETLLATPKLAKQAQQDQPVAKVAKGEFVRGLQRGGIHVVDGEYYRVHVSQRSGALYASVWNGHEFEFKQGAIKLLNPANKATAEQAKAFGEMTERCVYCLTPIDTPESTAVGYGPICASKFGLPWGE